MKSDRMGSILITGATGLLGGMCLWRWRERPEGVAALVREPDSLPEGAWPGVKKVSGDLTKQDSLVKALKQVRPGLVVACAAFTKVDTAEEEPELAKALNVEGAAVLAEATHDIGAALVHISSDAVYYGNSGHHQEDDAGGDLSVYAQSKLDGEKAVLSAHPAALVLRTCMFGWNQDPARTSLAEWIIGTLREGNQLNGFTDVRFNPLFTGSLSDLILAGVSKRLRGVYNLGAADGVSKFEFARMLAQHLDLDERLVNPALQAEVNLKARRPANPVMKVDRFFSAIGAEPPSLASEIEAFLEMERGNGLAELRRFGGYA